MKLNEFKDKLFKSAEEVGFSEYEIYYEGGESLEIQAFKKEVDKYSLNKTIGISFRGLYNGKMGYAYTEVMDDEAVELLVEKAKANAEIIEKEDKEIIFGGSENYQEFSGYNEELNKLSTDEKIKLTLQLEEEAYKCSDKVVGTGDCLLGTEETERRIINSKGLDVGYRANGIFGIMGPVVKDDEKVNNAYAFKVTNRLDEFDVEEIAKESVEEALAYFGAETVDTGKYRVMFKNSASGDLLQTFAGIFSADNAQKGLSLLKGKEGGEIGSDELTIVDNPFIEGSLCSKPFDAEGVAAYSKNVIDKGYLKTLLHNLKTAMKDEVESTGNAAKVSYSSPVGVAPTNLCIKTGEKSYNQMINTLENGVIITEMQGMHSGANAITGDFSLAAKGFLVENGKVIGPVEQITIAGNYFDLMKSVEEVGADFKLGIPSGGSCFGSPSIIVKELSIAGK